MHTDYAGFLQTPMSVVSDYMTVMAGEAKRTPDNSHVSRDAEEMETFEEVISWKEPEGGGR